MRRTMVFRNEAEQSTGAPSVGVIGPAFNNLPNRAGEGYRTMLVLDEPELGRSESYTRARGTRPGGQITVMPQETVAMVIVPHSRAMDLALREVVGAPYLCTWASRWTADSSLKCNVRFCTKDLAKNNIPKSDEFRGRQEGVR